MWSESADAVAAVPEALFVAFVWSLVLFNLGRGVLLCVTAGRHPRGRFLALHVDRLCAAGVAVLAMAWCAIAFYNPFHTGLVSR
ncbi:hypothetical protein [Dokdonella sp.]|uniref:hypothetical protein n=1 Tax=Dokdonella sp. TaxID=2291710 RepID=UPI00262705FD|nr:hypothetical protein [Dokdonella sp.]